MITQIEMQCMEAVKKIAREMSKPKEIDWEQRQWDLETRIFERLVREKVSNYDHPTDIFLQDMGLPDGSEYKQGFYDEAEIAHRAANQMLWQYRNRIEKGGEDGKA